MTTRAADDLKIRFRVPENTTLDAYIASRPPEISQEIRTLLARATPLGADKPNEYELTGGASLQPILALPLATQNSLGITSLRGKHSRIDVEGVALEPKEYNAYVGNHTPNEGLEAWRARRNVGFNSQRDTAITSRDTNLQDVNFVRETPQGRSRIVGSGAITEPLTGEYGSLQINGARASDGMEIDYYASPEARRQIEAGQFTGRVVMLDQDARNTGQGADKEIKVGFVTGDNPEQAMRDIVGSMGQRARTDMGDDNFTTITPLQYRAYVLDIQENPAHAQQLFGQWVEQNWVSMERFNQAFSSQQATTLAQGGLTREELTQIRTAAGIPAPTATSPGAPPQNSPISQADLTKIGIDVSRADGANAQKIEAFLRSTSSTNETRAGFAADGVLTDVEKTAVLNRMQLLNFTPEGRTQIANLSRDLNVQGVQLSAGAVAPSEPVSPGNGQQVQSNGQQQGGTGGR